MTVFRWCSPARTLRAVGLAVASLAGACDGDDDCCWLTLSPANNSVLVPGDWNGSLVDSAGLAGLEITVGGRTVVAQDFLEAQDREVSVKVGSTGLLVVFAKLVRDGSVVADGLASWQLEPNTSWDVRFERGPNTPMCIDWCDGYHLIPIAEAAARYRGEALWLLWTAWPTDLEPGVVYRSPAAP